MRCFYRWVPFVVCAALAGIAALGDAQTAPSISRLSLAGAVVAASDSTPIGNATVFIYTAAVRHGTSPFCPSCYPDCQKTARTDRRGRFRVDALDPQLVFRILVVADHFRPCIVQNIDPSIGPVRVALARLESDQLTQGQVLRGRVVDGEGRAVAGAEVAPYSVKTEQGTRYGDLQGIDLIAVTDQHGEFVLTSGTADVIVSVKVRSRKHATRVCRNLAFGASEHEIRLDAGATVFGRLIHGGRPVAGAEVGLAQTFRDGDTFVGAYTIGTNQDGFFEFVNVKADDDYFVYGLMASLQGRGGVPARQIRVAAIGSHNAIEPLEVEVAHRLVGHVVLSDGVSVPAGTRLLVSRGDAWDSVVQNVESDGGFAVAGLPTGPYSVAVSVDGYTYSLANRSLDLLTQFSLVGRVSQDVEGLVLELQPGPAPQIEREAQLKTNARTLRERALHGAEPLE